MGRSRKAEHWPNKLLMQLIPKTLISNFGGAHFRNARSVMFHPSQDCEALEALAKVMSTGYVSLPCSEKDSVAFISSMVFTLCLHQAGCVHFTGMTNPQACEIKVLMLLYSPDKRAYIGFIPNDQVLFLVIVVMVILVVVVDSVLFLLNYDVFFFGRPASWTASVRSSSSRRASRANSSSSSNNNSSNNSSNSLSDRRSLCLRCGVVSY